MLEELAGIFGGGGGFTNKSAATSASPFNYVGSVNFGGSKSGGIDAGDTSANGPEETSRQTLGGNQAYPDASLGYGFSTNPTDPNYVLWALIAGGAIIALLFAVKLLKR